MGSASGPLEKILSSLPTDHDPTGDSPPEIEQTTARFSDRLFQHRAVEVLRYRDFRVLWFGHVFGSMAFWMDQVTRGWLIYELTNSTVQLGMIRGVQAIPILFLSPIAGSVADRYSRRMQILITQCADGAMFAVLAILIVTGAIEPWHVYATAFGMAVVQTFHQPARAAIIADVVPRTHLTNAIGLGSMIFNVARSLGPALAGVLITVFGTGGAYAAQAFFFVLATFWTWQLSGAESGAAKSRAHASQHASLASSIVEGWRFSWQNETVRTALLITMLAALFIVPFTALLPVFARDILRVGASGQSLLLTAMGVGALGSAVMITGFGDRMPRGKIMLGGVALYGLGAAAFGASPWFHFSMLVMIVIGFANVCSHALVQTVLQTYSPPEFRGRTIALFHMSQVVMTLGSMIIGALAALFGAQWSVVLMGSAGALAMLGIHLALPKAWHIR
ncbi:MAG: MFS transporter [Deltaproteobacteria bacterium]|nr:MFS transporter [Deltaproteobacteria bacterium]